MEIEWTLGNQYEIAELRARIRDKDTKVPCAAVGCEYKATDVHHRDGDHSNNAPENLAPACKLCHNKVHDITAQMSDLKLLVRLFYKAQEQRKAAASTVRNYKALHIPVPYVEKALEDAQEYEDHLAKHIEAMLKMTPFYQAWLKKVNGIGPLLAGSLLAEIGSPQRFDTVSALWSYCGLGVHDGQAVRRRKGEKSGWHPMLKMTTWKIGVSFMKGKGLGRQLYDQYKAYYQQRDGPEPKWQPHRRAMRRVAKDLLRCMYIAWRESMGLEVTEPRPGTWPMPNDWTVENGSPERASIPKSHSAPFSVDDEGRGETSGFLESSSAIVPAPLDMEARQPFGAL